MIKVEKTPHGANIEFAGACNTVLSEVAALLASVAEEMAPMLVMQQGDITRDDAESRIIGDVTDAAYKRLVEKRARRQKTS